MTLDDKGWIFDGEFCQYIKQALFIAFFAGFYRQSCHRFWKFQRHEMDVVFIVRIVQYAVKCDVIDFGNRADVTCDQFIDFNGIFALQLV